MSGPARAGLFLYAKDLARVAAFYEAVLGMSRIHTSDELWVLQSADIQLIVHAMPAHLAATITIASPPQAREDSAMKFFFTVTGIPAAQATIAALGGIAFAAQWSGPGFRVNNACDPEGNVFQIRENAP